MIPEERQADRLVRIPDMGVPDTESPSGAATEAALNSTDHAEDVIAEWQPILLAYFIINSLLILMIIVGNITTIFLLIRYKSLRTATNTFAMSLACADLTMGFAYQFYNIINYSPCTYILIPLHYPCAISLYLIIVSAGCSLFTLTCIAIDRYIAVLHPLSYRTLITRCRARTMIILIWSYLCLAGLSIFAVYDKETEFYHDSACSLLNNIPLWYFFGIFIPHILILNIISKVLYLRIIYVAWKAESKIQEEQAVFRNRISRKEAKAAKMMGQILTLFLLCWAPYIVLHIALYIIGPSAASGLYTALEISKLLSLSNSYMNPIVYFWKNPDFREALGSCIRCRPHSSTNRVSITSVAEPMSVISASNS